MPCSPLTTKGLLVTRIATKRTLLFCWWQITTFLKSTLATRIETFKNIASTLSHGKSTAMIFLQDN